MNDAEQIGLAVGVVVVASLALQAALSPAMTTMVEAIKATGVLPPGWAGVVSLGCGTVLGLLTGVLAWQRAGDGLWVLIGAFAGLVLGAGGVTSHHAQVGAAALRRGQPVEGEGAGNPVYYYVQPASAAQRESPPRRASS